MAATPVLLDPHRPNQVFPPCWMALKEPNGLLAVGGCLSPQRIANAYRNGIFPWYNDGQPILWWSPDPRLVLFPERLQVSRSLAKSVRQQRLVLTVDAAFAAVMQACAEARGEHVGTWITDDMLNAYVKLHQLGIAHSVEAWHDGELVGGLYGLAMGRVFFGESMFFRRRDASKVAFVHLLRELQACGYRLVDCQVRSEHLLSLGAEEIPRARFLRLLSHYCAETPERYFWNPS